MPDRKFGRRANKEELAAVVIASRDCTGLGWRGVNCPVCPMRGRSPNRRRSLSLNLSHGGFRCFRCVVYGRLPGYAHISAAIVEADDQPKISPYAPSWFLSSTSHDVLTSLACAPGIAYAESRGFDEALRHKVDMGLAITGPHAECIIVPRKDADGKWWGYTARKWFHNCADPYRYPAGMSRDRLTNEQCLQVETDDPVLMMEGDLDALLYWPDVLTHGGKPIEAHVDVIKQTKRPVVAVLDGDAWHEGQNWMMRLRLEGVRAGAVRLPGGRDPNDRSHVDPVDVWRVAHESLLADRALCI